MTHSSMRLLGGKTLSSATIATFGSKKAKAAITWRANAELSSVIDVEVSTAIVLVTEEDNLQEWVQGLDTWMIEEI